jgi:hypothetical protein
MGRRLAPEVKAVRALTRLQYGRRSRGTAGRAAQRDRRLSRDWGWPDNIVGIGASRKQVGGEVLHGTPTVTIFVRRKRPRERLAASERVPELLHLATVGVDVVTDVVEIGSVPQAHAPIVRPLRPGCGGAHFLGEEGTLGLIVTQNGRPDPLILSCSHVLARSGLAGEGDVIEQPLGAAGITDAVAELTSVFTTLSTAGVNTEDIALARILDVIPRSNILLQSNAAVTSVSPLRADQFTAGTPTRLLGLMSPDARGNTITSESSFRVRDMPGVGDVRFTGLVAYRTECAGGDSGALVVSEDATTALGLHLAGTPTGLGLFLPLGPVFENHGLALF